ncbi:MAG: energy transducer TonB [Thermodesulfobacteriota bacterium]
MNLSTFAGTFGMEDPESRPGRLALFVGGSVLLHLALVAFVLGAPHMFRRKPVITPGSVITVDMVSLPEPSGPSAPAPTADMTEDVPLVTAEDVAEMPASEPVSPEVPLAEEFPAPAPETPPEPAPAPPPPPVQETMAMKDAPEPPPAASPAPAETPPEPILKRPDPRTAKPGEIERPAVIPDNARAESIQKAIQSIQKRVASAPASRSNGSRAGAGKAPRPRVSGGVSDVYKAQVRNKVEQNWAFSGNPSRGGELRAVVVARVRSDGGISDVWFEKRSGHALLDDSAYRAVRKANPLPPLPPGLDDYTVALVFTPSGLN